MAMSKSLVPMAAFDLSSQGPVRLRGYRTSNNTMALEMGVDYEKAEVPDRFYYADYCDVIRGRVGVNFIFGRLEPGGNRLRSQVEIAYPEDQFIRQLWKSSREIHETVRKQVGGKMPPPVNAESTDKTQTFRSNNVFMAVLGDEAVMDFYYVSPGDIHFAAVKKRKDIHLEPVIRIALNTAIMFEFFEKCRPSAEQLTPLVDVEYEQK
jgi:hypothetical protein